MEILKLLFSIIFITAFFPEEIFTEDKIIQPLLVEGVPKHYKIQLDVDVENNVFHGISNINITIYKQTQTISFNAANLNIIESTIKDIKDEIKVIKMLYVYTFEEIIILYFDSGLSPGTYILHLEFTGIISTNDTIGGFYKNPYLNEEGETEWFIATPNWVTGIRRTFPCWDEPGIRATFEIIVQHQMKTYMVLSNMPRSKINHQVDRNTFQTHFVITPDIPAYSITIVLCNLPIISKNQPENINLRSRQHFEHDLIFASHAIANATRYFKDKWSELNVLPMQQHFAVPGFIDNGLIKWGLSFYRTADIIYNEDTDYTARKMEVARLIGPEIGRQWLSSGTNPFWWPYFWLNEGIVTILLAPDIIDEIIPNSRAHVLDLFVVQVLQESLYLDGQGVMNPLISDDFDIDFSFSYYVKAPAIIRMLQHVLSDKVFRTGIDIYFKKRSVSLDDFLAVMQFAYDKIMYEKLNITEIMYPWITQNHYPVLNVELDVNRNICMSNITIENTTENTTWSIPITFAKELNINLNTSSSALIKSGEAHVEYFGQEDFIILNLQQTGYYRVRYDDENWKRIARYLNSENYKNIQVLNRAQIIDDAFYFTKEGQLNVSIFWELTKYLSRETKYVAWYPMIKVIERISYIISFPQYTHTQYTYFQNIVRQLQVLLQKIGYDEEPNDSYFTKCLRQEAVKWACILNSDICKRMAVKKLQWHLSRPLNHKLLPEWKKWTYCNGLSMENMTVSERVHDMYLNKIIFQKDRKIIEFLACSASAYVSKKIGKDSIDKITFFHYIIEKHAKEDFKLDYILANWMVVKPKEISTVAALIDIINHVYSKKQLDKIMTFAKDVIEVFAENNCFNYQSLSPKISNKINELARNEIIQLITDVKIKIDTRLLQIIQNTYDFVFDVVLPTEE